MTAPIQFNEASSNASATTIAVAQGSNPVLGRTNLVWVTGAGASTVSSVTDTLGNTYVSRGVSVEVGINRPCHQFSSKITAGGGANTVTANYGAATTQRCIYVVEAAGDYDAGNTGQDSGNNPTSTVSAAASLTPSTVYSLAFLFQGGTPGVGTGYTSIGAGGSAGFSSACLGQYKEVAATGTYSANFVNAAIDRSAYGIMVVSDVGANAGFSLARILAKVKATGSGVTTLSTAAVDTKTTGSTFGIFVVNATGVAPATRSDNKGNTYSLVTSQAQAGGATGHLYHCENGVGGTGHTATVTWGSAADPSIFFFEVDGVLAASYDSGALAQTDDTASPYNVTSGTLAQDDSLVVVLGATAFGGPTIVYSESTGFTVDLQEGNGDLFWTGFVASRNVGDTVAVTPNVTATGNGGTGIGLIVLAYKAKPAPTVDGHGLAYDFIGTSGASLSTSAFDTTTGGVMLVSTGRGVATDFASAVVSDNKGNGAYSQEGVMHNYTAFPSSGVALHYKLNPIGGTGHTVNATKPTATDELTVIAVHALNVNVIQDAEWVEDTSGPTNVSASVTTTGPALLVAFWWGDNASGELDPDPGSGWVKRDHTSSLASNHVQAATATKPVLDAGTYSITWTPTTSQGAQLWLVALQNNDSPPVVTGQPVSQSLKAGERFLFSPTVTGADSYQWESNSGAGYSDIAGQTSLTLSGLADRAYQNVLFRLKSTNGAGTVASNAVSLNIRYMPSRGRNLAQLLSALKNSELLDVRAWW